MKCAKQVCGQAGKGVSMTVTHVCLACFNMPEDVSTWYVGRHGGQKVRAIRNEGHAHELAKCDDRAHHIKYGHAGHTCLVLSADAPPLGT